MEKFLNALRIIFSTLLIILIINLTGIIVIDKIFYYKLIAEKTIQTKPAPDNRESGYSTEMKDIGELFGYVDEPSDNPIKFFDEIAIVETPKIGISAILEENNESNEFPSEAQTQESDKTAAVNAIYNKYYGIL